MAIIQPFAETIAFVLSYMFDTTSSYGFSIVILTVLINIIIFPLTLRQTRSTKRMQDAQPQLQKLQKQHKDNKEELNKAVAEFYKEKGINPFGCIFPLIVQMPIWFALFRVLREPLLFLDEVFPEGSSLGLFLSGNPPLFYGMDLQVPPSQAGTIVEKVPYIALVLLVVLTALYQQKQITKKSNNPNNPQAKQMQTIGKIMPLFFGFISWTLPTGLVVYFLTGNIFRIGQQSLIVKLEDKEEKSTPKEEKKHKEEDDIENSKDEETENRRKNRKKRRKGK